MVWESSETAGHDPLETTVSHPWNSHKGFRKISDHRCLHNGKNKKISYLIPRPHVLCHLTPNLSLYSPFSSQFWLSATQAIAISLVCTLSDIFDVPVYWPILLMYFCILFAITMRRQIRLVVLCFFTNWSQSRSECRCIFQSSTKFADPFLNCFPNRPSPFPSGMFSLFLPFHTTYLRLVIWSNTNTFPLI